MRKPILTIFYQFNPWHSSIGGIQTVITNFIKYAPEEFEVRLVGTGCKTDEAIGEWQEAELAGKAVQFMPILKLQNDNVRSLIPTTVKYTTALLGRCFASDFMHFHRLEPTMTTLNWQGDKTLFIHNDIQKQIQAKDSANAILWKRIPQVYFLLERQLIQQFNHILSCNSDSVKLYQERYPEIADRVSYIRNTVDTEVFYALPAEERKARKAALAQKLGLPETTKFALFAGRLHPQKDPLLLVRSIAALADSNVHLLIAGDGELATEIQAEVKRLDLSKQVSMLGSLTKKELADLHQVASVFVLTSAYEGLPLVALEALSCGTPIVTTQCGDTPNLLTANSGVVCPERTPQAVAVALRQVLQQPENYPDEACMRAVAPYAAHKVIHEVYRDMWQRWEQRALLSAA